SQSSDEALQPHWPHQLTGSPQQGTPLILPRCKCEFRGGFGEAGKPVPTEPEPRTAIKEENKAVLRLSFPRKLWMIVEDAAFTSVCWINKGDMVVIEADLFQTEVLQGRGMDRIFETDSIKSFIHGPNLCGFSKIHPLGLSLGKRMMIYHNSNFQRDKPLLLQNIWRKGDPVTTAQPTTGTRMTPKRKKPVVMTRRSP
ncbi:hypothetical protein Celaphus_00009595, partial [Cervus elaphus hippelaphus]